MAIAALVASIIAIVIAAASANYARQQARSAEGTRAIEAARRHDELTPRLTGTYVNKADTREKARPAVTITNRGPLDLERIEIQVMAPSRSQDAAIKGIYDPGTGDTRSMHTTGPLARGDSWTALEVLPVHRRRNGQETHLEIGGVVTFRCRSYAADEEPWVTLVEVKFPSTPFVY